MSEGVGKNLAERIALLLHENETEASDFSSLRSSVEKINERLSRIEMRLDSTTNNRQTAILNSQPLHSSQEKFLNLQEIADDIISNTQNEKACPYEPTSKPCDHCAMCNSRGF
jgi:hypothetical protein